MKTVMKTAFLFLLVLATVGVVNAQNGDSGQIFLQKARAERNVGHLLPAYNHLQESVKYNPRNVEAQLELAQVSQELRKYDVARIAYAKVNELKPNDPTVLEPLTHLSFQTRKFDDAIKYGTALINAGKGSKINYVVGKSYYEQENYGQAFRYLQAASEEDPKNAEIYYLFARGYVQMSNYRNAVKYFEQAITIDTAKPRWVYEMAMTYSAIPDDKTAVKYYELAATRGYKMDNDFVENLALSCVLSGQPDKGINLMKQLLEKKPADLNLLYNLAETYYKTGRYQEAIDYWDKILVYDKEDARALYMIGMAYQKKGDKNKGMLLCDKAIQMDPSLASMRTQKMSPGL